MSRLPKTPDPFGLTGCYIAGGAILSIATKTDINDYDIYPKSAKGFEDVIHTLHDSNCFVVNISDRAITYKSNDVKNDKEERAIIQVMTYDYFDTPEKIYENFDFSVCMGAFDCDTKSYNFHPDFYPDIATKTLRFNHKTRYPLNSLLRVHKYAKKGFFISKPESTKLALTIAKTGMPNSWEELEAQIGGSYGREIELQRKDMEFSFENAIELLSDMVFDFDQYLSISEEDYHDIPPEDIVAFYSNGEKIKYLEVPLDGSSWNPTSRIYSFFICDDTFIGGTFNTAMVEKFGMPEHFECVTETRLYGYKVLSEDSVGKLVPPISPKNGIIYSLDGETVWEKTPYLYVFKTKKAAENRMKTAKNTKLFLVSFDSNDIKQVSSDEIQVTKMKLEKEITE
jgi:hypothetical protein